MKKKEIIKEMENIYTTICDVDGYTNEMALEDFAKLLNRLNNNSTNKLDKHITDTKEINNLAKNKTLLEKQIGI